MKKVLDKRWSMLIRNEMARLAHACKDIIPFQSRWVEIRLPDTRILSVGGFNIEMLKLVYSGAEHDC